MEQIKQYTIIQNIKSFNENLSLWHCEDLEQNNWEVLTIKTQGTYQKLWNRIQRGILQQLINQEINGVQNIVEVNFDDKNHCYYVVYEYLDTYSIFSNCRQNGNIQSIIDIAKGLDFLKKKNHEAHFISPSTILINERGNAKLKFVGLFELFKNQELLEKSYLAPNVVDWLNNTRLPRPKFQDDIYSLVKSFEFLLKENLEEAAIQILSKSLCEDRKQRFSKYFELLELLEQLPIKRKKNSSKRLFGLQ